MKQPARQPDRVTAKPPCLRLDCAWQAVAFVPALRFLSPGPRGHSRASLKICDGCRPSRLRLHLVSPFAAAVATKAFRHANRAR